MRLRVRRLLLLGVVCCVGAALLLLALALAPVAAVLMPAAFVTGVAIEQFGVAWEVSIQEHVPADKLARVYSYDALGSLMAVPVGQMAAGPLADALGRRAGPAGRGRRRACWPVVGMLASRTRARRLDARRPCRRRGCRRYRRWRLSRIRRTDRRAQTRNETMVRGDATDAA